MNCSRSVGASSTSSADAMSPVWIQHSERRVAASVCTDSWFVTHVTRACGSATANAASMPADASCQRCRIASPPAPRSTSTCAAAALSTVAVWSSRRPINPSRSGARSPRVLAIASSSVCARCTSTEATSQPSQRVGRSQSAAVQPSTRAPSSACWAVSAVRRSSIRTTYDCVEPRRTETRRRGMGRIAFVVTVAVCIAACSSAHDVSARSAAAGDRAPTSIATKPPPAAGSGETAVWSIRSDEHLTSASRTFTAYVTRLGCNGGVTGTVRRPTIREGDTRVVVTFTVEAATPGGHSCQGNGQVPIAVHLASPLGDRVLVDGACRTGSEAATTTFCADGSVRWKR